MNLKALFTHSLTLGVILSCSLTLSAFAVSQAKFELLGVSPDLSKLGVSEFWVNPTTGKKHCEVRIYKQDQWDVVDAKTLDETGQEQNVDTFMEQCDLLKRAAIGNETLTKLKWKQAGMDPAPISIKDETGTLKSNLDFIGNFPKDQRVDFTLSPNNKWQIWLQSQYAGPYTIAFRPAEEPIPYQVIQSKYTTTGPALVMPLKMLSNAYYGLVIVMFREVYKDAKGDTQYRYRPYFTKWPDYVAMSIDEAKTILNKASEYAMEPSDLVKGPNTMTAGYRAYLRIRSAGLSLDEIDQNMNQASYAGKLYWLAVLRSVDQEAYEATVEDMLLQTPSTIEVIEQSGSKWQPKAWTQLLKQQAQVDFN